MLKCFINPKNKNCIFICQITENYLKVIKCLPGNGSKRHLAGLELEPIPADTDDKQLAEKLNQLFKKLKYNNNPVIIALSHNYVTSRYLKVPTQAPQEIERIVSLQASRYLPYPVNELIAGYQLISTDKDGYSRLNIIIVPRDIVERYLKIFQEINIKNLDVTLGVYGLCSLYFYIEPNTLEPAMIIDINLPQVEVAIVFQEKLLFSRSFRIAPQEPNWQRLFIEEIRKTKDAYSQEMSDLNEEPKKIILVGLLNNLEEFSGLLGKELTLPVKVLNYLEKVPSAKNFSEIILNANQSLASLIGLSLKDVPTSLSLLPQHIKEERKKISLGNERLRFIAYVLTIILILGLAVVNNLDNKKKYLERIKIELNKISKEARPLEEIERRFKILEDQTAKRASSLDTIYEMHKVIPPQISLVNFSYEESNQVSMRGISPELNNVIAFVSGLEKSPVFKNFNIKIRYATKKATAAGETIEFEIICSKVK